MEHSTKHFSLVVLCYKAEETIIPFVEKLHQSLSRYRFSWELVLVANFIRGSTDRTPQVVQELSQRFANTRYISEPKDGMMGWDLRKGLEISQGDYIGVIDGDGQFPVEAVFSCLALIELENLDIVKTYRVQRDDGFYRNLISKTYNLLFSILFGSGLRDVNSKPKIMRRSVYEKMKLQSDDWFIDAEIMIKAREYKLKIGEIPTHFYAQEDRSSFVKPRAILEFIWNLINTRLRLKKITGNIP